jgi:predicted esterase
MHLGLGISIASQSIAASVAQLVPPGASAAQNIDSFVGAVSGHVCSGHRLWLPDAITLPGSPTAWMTARGISGGATLNYADHTGYKLLVMNHGIGQTVSNSETSSLPQIKAEITAGRLDPCVVLWPSGLDPDDGVDAWCRDCADGSFPAQTQYVQDLIPYVRLATRVNPSPTATAIMGFSRGGNVTLTLRAKYDTALAACYVVMGAPRLDGAFSSEAVYYASWTAGEKTKIWADVQAAAVAGAPLGPTGLFAQYGVGSAHLFMLRSDPGDTTTSSSMNNANTKLTTATVPFTAYNCDDGDATPTHSMSAYLNATVADGANNVFAWLQGRLAA